MRRTTSLTAATLLGAALLTAPTAIAAGETCRGEAATIVGTGPTIQGTDGRDVIVTDAGTTLEVHSGGGDDLICVVPSTVASSVMVDAGPGNDVVDGSTSGFVEALLGSGQDRFLGGPGADHVTSEGADDVVHGGDGFDSVYVVITDAAAVGFGSYDGGAGVNGVYVSSSTADIEMELDEQIIVGGRTAADITGFTSGSATAPRATLRGNAEDNWLSVSGCELRADGEGGDDSVAVVHSDITFPEPCDRTARLSGGRCDDTLYGWNGRGRDRLVGNAGDDIIKGWDGADLLMGGAGNDHIVGGRGPDLLKGNAGDDTMVGKPGNDTLLGAQGQDVAGGGEGRRDRCEAETTRNCER